MDGKTKMTNDFGQGYRITFGSMRLFFSAKRCVTIRWEYTKQNILNRLFFYFPDAIFQSAGRQHKTFKRRFFIQYTPHAGIHNRRQHRSGWIKQSDNFLKKGSNNYSNRSPSHKMMGFFIFRCHISVWLYGSEGAGNWLWTGKSKEVFEFELGLRCCCGKSGSC